MYCKIIKGLIQPGLEPTIYLTQGENTNNYTIDEPTIFIDGVMLSVLALSEVDRGFIGGVMVSVLALTEVDRGFIDGVIVNVLALSEVDRGFIDGVMEPLHQR
jgi:hypothetical protein